MVSTMVTVSDELEDVSTHRLFHKTEYLLQQPQEV